MNALLFAVRMSLLVLFSSAILILPSQYRRRAAPFRLAKLNIELPYRAAWDVPLDDSRAAEIASILSQPFTYLGRGRQSFAFESQDGQYVLKLFRFDSCVMKWGQALVLQFRKLAQRRVHLDIKWEETLSSCKLAIDSLREETGIVHAHLNPGGEKWPLIEVKDFLGFSHRINPSKYRFVLQKKGEQIFQALRGALATDPATFRRMVHSFSALLRSLEEKEIAVLDWKMPSNFGFLGEKAIQLDFASNVRDPLRSAQQSAYFREGLRGWLEKVDPESIECLE